MRVPTLGDKSSGGSWVGSCDPPPPHRHAHTLKTVEGHILICKKSPERRGSNQREKNTLETWTLSTALISELRVSEVGARLNRFKTSSKIFY